MEIIKTQGIVLKTIKYGDNSLIAHIFTESHGRLSFFCKGALKKKNKLKNLLFPFSILKIEFSFAQNKSLQYFKEINLNYPPIDFFSMTEKLPVVFLLSELFEKTIKPDDTNTIIYNFIYHLVYEFQDMQMMQNTWFIQILVMYLQLLGIVPEVDDTAFFFNLDAPEFTRIKPENSMFFDKNETKYFIQLLNNKNREKLPEIPKEKRLPMIEKILRYYQIHLGTGEINSFKILKKII